MVVENNTTNTQVALTIYEDAQDGLVDGWVIYKEDNETNISNIYDVDKASNVIKLERGAMSDTYFVLGDKNSGWANNDSNTIQWSMNTTNTFKITILVKTTNGTRYIKYDDSNTNRGQYKEDSIQYGLGTASKDGTWKTFTRNLALDLKDANRSSLLPEIQQAEANNTIVSINGFRIDGNMRVDNIAMIQDGTITEDTNTTIEEIPTIPNPVETNTTTVTDQNQTIDINGTIINVSNTAEFKSALTTAQDGDTILLAPGIYDNLNEIVILQNNLTIASHYLTTGNQSYIDSTILRGTGDKEHRIFDGSRVAGSSENIKFIGFTIDNSGKFITFTYGNGNLVDHCKINGIRRDSISFDTEAGGQVLHCIITGSGDDALDIDTKLKGNFEFAYNQLLDSHDDGIEVHQWADTKEKIVDTMRYNFHDNIIKNSGKDGIQLIDFHDKTNREFTISNNTISNCGHVGVGMIYEVSQHEETGFVGTDMTERVVVRGNIFDSNQYHLLGGDNMLVENNEFKNATNTAIKRVKGDSVIQNNTYINNAKDFEDSNN
ncbi:MAG: hypothetical protein KU29_03525 [Sulfurovum sp. FS06-10]|nr:MAG: hypothetical protein KU29_03525 [Sulfurovum sp. FS06-10]